MALDARGRTRAMGEKAGAAHYDSILAAADARGPARRRAAATLRSACDRRTGPARLRGRRLRLEGEPRPRPRRCGAAERAFRPAREVAAAQGAGS
jgi:hypothetical protein